MSLRKQIKQKVMDLAYKAEMTLHHFRMEYKEQSSPSPRSKKEKKQDSGQVRTYYNNSKEERKLH